MALLSAALPIVLWASSISGLFPMMQPPGLMAQRDLVDREFPHQTADINRPLRKSNYFVGGF